MFPGSFHESAPWLHIGKGILTLAASGAWYARCPALPLKISRWSLTTLREMLIKIGAKVIVHARYVTFQMAEVAVSRELFDQILDRIDRLRLVPDTG